MTTVHTRPLQQNTRSTNNNYTKDNLKLTTKHMRQMYTHTIQTRQFQKHSHNQATLRYVYQTPTRTSISKKKPHGPATPLCMGCLGYHAHKDLFRGPIYTGLFFVTFPT